MKVNVLLAIMLSSFILFCGLGEALGLTLLDKEEALKLMLPEAEEVVKETKTLTPGHKALILSTWKWKVGEDSVDFYIGKAKCDSSATAGDTTGVATVTTGIAFITSQPGLHGPIALIVGMEPDGRVRDVAVMAFQEKRGKPVKEKSYLKQYVGKTSKDPLSPGKDIDAITGATKSSLAVTIAVKKALILYDVLYLQGKDKPAAE